MPKAQDLFVKPDKSKLLDVKLLMEVVEMPTEPTIETSEDGKSTYENFYVKLSHQGQVYDLKLNAAQITRIFTHRGKSGEIFWKAKAGDVINFWYASNQKMPQRPYFAAEPVKDGKVSMVAAAEEVFTPASSVSEGPEGQVEAPKAKPTFAKSNAFRKEEPKWDGTPRESGFRQARAGLLQAILSNPLVDPFDDETVKKACARADELVAENRKAAKKLEQTITD
jgi:hypothetical protein